LKRGFTAVELLIVVGLILIIGIGTLIGFKKIYKEYKFNEYAFMLETYVRKAKIYAMERSRNTNVCISGKTVSLVDTGGSRRVNCEGDTIDSFTIDEDYINITGRNLGFDPRGFSINTGSICIDNNERYTKVVVGRWGAVRVEEGKGTCS